MEVDLDVFLVLDLELVGTVGKQVFEVFRFDQVAQVDPTGADHIAARGRIEFESALCVRGRVKGDLHCDVRALREGESPRQSLVLRQLGVVTVVALDQRDVFVRCRPTILAHGQRAVHVRGGLQYEMHGPQRFAHAGDARRHARGKAADRGA